MDLRQLRYFLEIAEQGSLSRAAARLHVAQPALSIHLRNMEAALGTELLLRSRSGVVPTEAGEVLLRHARRMLDEQARAEDEIRSLGRDPAGEVRLGLPGTISDIVTVPLIEQAGRMFPRVRLTISEAMSGFVAGWLRDGQVDLAILYSAPAEAGMESVKLLEEELVAIAAPRDLPGAEVLPLATLAGLPLILPSRAHGLRQMLDAEAGVRGLTLQAAIEIDSYKNIKALVMRGFGVSVLPLHAVAAESRAGRLIVRPLAPTLRRGAWLAHRTTRPATRAIRAIHDLMPGVVQGLIRMGTWPGGELAGSCLPHRPHSRTLSADEAGPRQRS